MKRDWATKLEATTGLAPEIRGTTIHSCRFGCDAFGIGWTSLGIWWVKGPHTLAVHIP